MAKDFEYGIVIGRFQPFHRAHHEIVHMALALSEKVIIIIGSHNRAPDPRNPFSSDERTEIMLEALGPEAKTRIQFLPISDYDYNDDAWTVDAQQKVSNATNDSESICLVGHKSDLTSYYLDSFPTWKFIDYSPNHPIHATVIRDHYFKHDNNFKEHLGKGVIGWMENFKKTPKFAYLKDYFDDCANYQELFRGNPFGPPIHHTVDCVVIKSSHVLLTVRKGKMGRGLYALPGGFLNANEVQRDAAIRELKEETGIKVEKKDLFAAIKAEKSFDAVGRSLRGRTITQAYLLKLGPGLLPKIKGGDDAEHALWMPLGEYLAQQNLFFEDHWHMIYYFANVFGTNDATMSNPRFAI